MFGKKKELTIQTGVIQVWDEDTSTGIDHWNCYYKGVCFGEFHDLSEAHQRLQDLLGLDEFYQDKKLKAQSKNNQSHNYSTARSPALNKLREDAKSTPAAPPKKKEDS